MAYFAILGKNRTLNIFIIIILFESGFFPLPKGLTLLHVLVHLLHFSRLCASFRLTPTFRHCLFIISFHINRRTVSTTVFFNPSLAINSSVCILSLILTRHIFLFIRLSALLRIRSSTVLNTHSEPYVISGFTHVLYILPLIFQVYRLPHNIVDTLLKTFQPSLTRLVPANSLLPSPLIVSPR